MTTINVLEQVEITMEAKSCPFCHGEKLSTHSCHMNADTPHSVACHTCKANGPERRTKREAIVAWNGSTERMVKP